MVRKSIPFFLAVLGFQLLTAQNLDKLYDKAEALLYEEKMSEALELYTTIVQSNPSFKDADYKREICLLLTTERQKPIDQLLAFEKTKARVDKLYLYWLGKVYFMKYEFDDAHDTWKKFLSMPAAKDARYDVVAFKKKVKYISDFLDDRDDYEIHQLDGEINSPAAELSPAFFPGKNELIFASSRDSKPGEDVFKIYHSIKQKDGWSHITPINILGTFDRETANIEVVNEDGKLFLFNSDKGGDLYYSETRNDNWVMPVEFDSKITSTHLKSHFFINEHEDRVIFATDKNYKSHGLDLFQSFKDHVTGKWTKPAPFADIINSTEDEDSPYLSADEKRLYFSSKGHGSIGGYDIFVSYFDSTKLQWSKPVNMGFPINSPDDEVHFKMNPDDNSGFFSSNRMHSKGDFDIYFFYEIEKVNIEGRVYDATTRVPVTDAFIRFTPSAYTDEHFRSELNDKGKYKMEIISDEVYLVEIMRGREVLFTDEFEIHETGGMATTYLKDFVVNKPTNYHRPAIIASTVNEPTQRKVETPVRQTTSQPVTQTPAQQPKQEPVAETKPSQEKPPVQTQSKPIAQNNSKPVESKPQPKPESKPQTTTMKNLASYALGTKVIIPNIYFDFGTSGLSKSASPVLAELLEVLKANPGLRVEVGGHTDNRGNPEANIWLSQRRAENVMKWLIERGIKPDRLTAKGYGSSQPIASNDDEQNGRELNRRIEVRSIR